MSYKCLSNDVNFMINISSSNSQSKEKPVYGAVKADMNAGNWK